MPPCFACCPGLMAWQSRGAAPSSSWHIMSPPAVPQGLCSPPSVPSTLMTWEPRLLRAWPCGRTPIPSHVTARRVTDVIVPSLMTWQTRRRRRAWPCGCTRSPPRACSWARATAAPSSSGPTTTPAASSRRHQVSALVNPSPVSHILLVARPPRQRRTGGHTGSVRTSATSLPSSPH